jgi:FAD/FMN-containing dehydrogenase
MLFHGLTQQEAEATWRPFLAWLAASPQDFALASPPVIIAAPARQFWNAEVLKQVPGIVLSDDRPGAPASNIFWAGNLNETGQVLHGYQSAWMPASLLQPSQRERLVDALFAASRHWQLALHVNKGLAGAPADAIAAARDTATNPAALDAFALMITASQGQPAYPGIAGREPNLSAARTQAEAIQKAADEIRKIVPNAGSYVSESNFFEADWGESFWGANYARLRAAKDKYDPGGLFFVHHGVGSERWSADGFTPSAR